MWAGKRTLNGRPVVDGVITNPLAHATATALRLAGARRVEDVDDIELELFRANEIESDDTSSVLISTNPTEGSDPAPSISAPTIAGGFTLCAETERAPSVTVYGSTGSIRLEYTLDRVHWIHDGGTVTTEHPRIDLLTNLLAARRDGTALLNPLADNGAFMRVMEAVRTAPDPKPIPPEYVRWEGDGVEARPIVRRIDAALQRVADDGIGLSRTGVPWAGRT